MYWQPGHKLKTRPYQIEATIGQGGFGVTYKVQHLELKHQVVLKTPNAMLRNDPAYPRFKERFLKEGQMLAQLSQQSHPSIVRVSDLFTEDDIPCLVMDLVPGDSLFNLVQERGPIPETEAVGYIRQIAEALVVSHDMGIVHRDAHALNIMVANQNRAVLIDFGIAGDVAPMVSNTRNAFNPAFAPYEQILGGGGLPTVDVYSLGASLYYAVTGQLPTPAAKRKLDNLALVPPKQHNPQTSDKLQATIIKAMAVEAAERPQTMRDFLALLQAGANQVGTRDALSLRGYFSLPEMKTQGMVRRLGLRYIREVIPLNQELTIVIAGGGATLFNLRTGEALWEIDCPANGGAVTADGRLLALRRNQDIYLWDLATGKFLHQLTGHTDDVKSVAFSPNGKILASGSRDDTVRLWDVATGQLLQKLTGHTDDVYSVALNPNGKILASGSGDDTVRLWDVATGQLLQKLTGHQDGVISVAFSPNGQILTSGGGDGVVRLWDVATGQILQKLTGHTHQVWSVSFSPDGKYLASGSTDATVRLWDLSTGNQRFRWDVRDDDYIVYSVAFSPDGQILASGSGGHDTVRLWDVATGRRRFTLNGRINSVQSIAFSPNSQTIACGSISISDRDTTLLLWDVATGKRLWELSNETEYVKCTSLAFSPDGRTLASGYEYFGNDETVWIVHLRDVTTGKPRLQLREYEYSVKSIAFSPNGQILAFGRRLWDLSTGKQLLELTGFTGASIAFSPNGEILASGSRDNTVRLWDVATGRERSQLTGHISRVRSVSFSADGKYLASGSDDKTVRLWDVATGKELKQLTGHTEGVLSVSFSADGKYLASGSDDKTVRLWDVATGRELRQLTGHTHSVNSVSFSLDGKYLASGSKDGVMRLWRV